ncbi:Arm DNA-binding domain-containing protein [Hymenobacter latericoloratus]|nr:MULTISPECIES: Arm DNA-binding domain-containing protein [Hymenobacter]
MNTQFVLRRNKMDSAGRCPVVFNAYFGGLRLRHSTGEMCKPSEWNEDKQRFRSSYPLAEEANLYLSRLMTDALA